MERNWGLTLCSKVSVPEEVADAVTACGDPGTLQTTELWEDCQGQWQVWYGAGLELAWSWPGPMRQALWAKDGRAWGGRAAQAFWSPEHYEWIPGARHWAAGFHLHCWRLVFIWFVCNHALVIPSWSKKYVTQFGVYRNTWETLDFKEILERLNF